MTVRDELAAIKQQTDKLYDTPCANCGHRYGSHISSFADWQRCCTTTGYKNMKAVWCKCRRFVDPSECLNMNQNEDSASAPS